MKLLSGSIGPNLNEDPDLVIGSLVLVLGRDRMGLLLSKIDHEDGPYDSRYLIYLCQGTYFGTYLEDMNFIQLYSGSSL